MIIFLLYKNDFISGEDSMYLVLRSPLIGLNEYISICRGNRYMAAKKKKSIENNLIVEILQQTKGKKIEHQAKFYFKWYAKNKKHDPDNICFAKKFILDSIVKAGLMRNDGWKEVKEFADNFFVDKENARVEIEIVEG